MKKPNKQTSKRTVRLARKPARQAARSAVGRRSSPRRPAAGKRSQKVPGAPTWQTPAVPRGDNWRGEVPATMAGPRIPVAEIIIGKRHRTNFGDLAGLAANINENGLLQPVAIDTHKKLIAGERRIRSWQLSKFRAEPIPYHVVPIDDLVAGEWAENDPALRKDFTPSEAVAIKRAIETRLRSAALIRQHAGAAGAQKSPRDEASKSGARAAAYTGNSRRTLEKAEAVVDAADRDPEKFGRLKEDMDRTGRVDGVYKRLKNLQAADGIRAEPPPAPGGAFRAGVIDFPWASEPDAANPNARGRGYYPYPTMNQAQLVAYARDQVRPILHDDCVVALWIPNYHLARGDHAEILAAMDLEPKTILTWVKTGIGQGQIARGSTEHAIIARRGKNLIETPFPRTHFAWPVDRKHHSRKPQDFFDLFAKHVAAPRYFSLFETVDRGEKWICHGDKIEATKKAVAPARKVAGKAKDAEQPVLPFDQRAHSVYRLSLGFPLVGGFRVTPAGQKIVPEILQPGMIVRTSYGAGPYEVLEVSRHIDRPKRGQKLISWSLACIRAGAEKPKKGKPKPTAWLNEVVAVDGRLLALLEANADEVFIVAPGEESVPAFSADRAGPDPLTENEILSTQQEVN